MWPQLAQAFIMMIVSYAIQALTAPKPQAPDAGQLDIPVAGEGDKVPVLFGTDVNKNTHVIWYGDANTIPIKSKGGKK